MKKTSSKSSQPKKTIKESLQSFGSGIKNVVGVYSQKLKRMASAVKTAAKEPDTKKVTPRKAEPKQSLITKPQGAGLKDFANAINSADIVIAIKKNDKGDR